MELESYELTTDEDKSEFLFFSEGPRGRIKKVVRFKQVTV